MIGNNKRVLVVDDEPIVRQSYELALSDAGYSVCTVAGGSDALRTCRAGHFDLMLIDLWMPDMDGLELARAVATEFPGVRMVIVTGYPSQESAQEAAGLTISGYLEKPISPDRLCAAVADALAAPREDLSPREPVTIACPEPETANRRGVARRFANGLADLAVACVVPLIGFAYYVLLPFVLPVLVFAVIGMEMGKAAGWLHR